MLNANKNHNTSPETEKFQTEHAQLMPLWKKGLKLNPKSISYTSDFYRKAGEALTVPLSLQAVKYISLVSIETMQGICFLASKPGWLEVDSKSSATLWLTLVMICMSSSSLPYFAIISQRDWMNQEPVMVFLQE